MRAYHHDLLVGACGGVQLQADRALPAASRSSISWPRTMGICMTLKNRGPTVSMSALGPGSKWPGIVTPVEFWELETIA
jgi:hypothetical protein